MKTHRRDKQQATDRATDPDTGNRLIQAHYLTFLSDIKTRIRQAQTRAALSVNRELILLYCDIGRMIAERQQREGWGAAVIPRLARDIHNELPEVKGFSERNIGRMIAFYKAYPTMSAILPQPAAKLPLGGKPSFPAAQMEPSIMIPQAVAKSGVGGPGLILQQLASELPWGHNVLLMEKVKDLATRLWYMRQTIKQGWSRNVLALMIDNRVHQRQGAAVTNFADRLPPEQSDLAQQALKDPYIFDFLTLMEPFHERELETGLLRHVQKFLLELGQGFAFVGRQYHVEVGQDDFYLDLLFYHLQLRCFVAIDLKKGAFKAEYAGKMNFYCNVVDDRLRHANDNPTIGLILCQDKNRLVAEYALKGVNKAIGVSQYQLTRALPKELRSSLPSVEDLEAELDSMLRKRQHRGASGISDENDGPKPRKKHRKPGRIRKTGGSLRE
ncbi:MAG: PDDEXK nuclease domain-containing protein [bacterium]|nr:PDDEXK nuclease domain-containing protein [bacterium]